MFNHAKITAGVVKIGISSTAGSEESILSPKVPGVITKTTAVSVSSMRDHDVPRKH